MVHHRCWILLLILLALTATEEKAAVGSKAAPDSALFFADLPFAMPEITLPRIPNRQVRITAYGALGDGRAMNTTAFSRAIEACHADGGGRVIVPAGIWLTGPIVLKDNIDLHLEKNACIVFSPQLDQYPVVHTQYEGVSAFRRQSPISGRDLENIAITGPGLVDGSGQAWRPVKKMKMTSRQWKELITSGGVLSSNGTIWHPSRQAMEGEALLEKLRKKNSTDPAAYAACAEYLRPVMVSLVRCKKVLLDGPTFSNSPAWNLHPFLCEDVVIRNLTVRNPWYSQNGDGLDIESCRRVLVEECSFDVGDDAICVKSGKGEQGRRLARPCEWLVVRDCTVYHGHGGFTIGSEMSGGVRNVAVQNCTFIGTDMGVRFKSTRGRGGVVENIYIENIYMQDIPTDAIGFNLFYSNQEPLVAAADEAAFVAEEPVSEETPRFRRIYLKNILCRGAGRAVFLQGLPEMPIEEIELHNSTISSKAGFYAEDAQSVVVDHLSLDTTAPMYTLTNCREVTLRNTLSLEKGVALRVRGPRSAQIRLPGIDQRLGSQVVEQSANVPADAVLLPE
ncbi:glycoside hydrolase family 28 protein [bacterium]|nr:glycoside hydrolase family 28 protein [bacterium]